MTDQLGGTGTRLTLHLLPYVACRRLREITVEDVDRYRARKLTEWARRHDLPAEEHRKVRQPIGPPTIIKTLTRRGRILEDAMEYGHIARNPARGKRKAPADRGTARPQSPALAGLSWASLLFTGSRVLRAEHSGS